MSKAYILKVNNCWACPSFEHVYIRYCFHCLETGKRIKYKDSEAYEKIEELYAQCPLMEWGSEKTDMCIDLYKHIDKIKYIELNVEVDK